MSSTPGMILDASPSLFELMKAVSFGESLPSTVAMGHEGAAVTTVVAAPGYPDSPLTGTPIQLPPPGSRPCATAQRVVR